jgi:hypothetical protein
MIGVAIANTVAKVRNVVEATAVELAAIAGLSVVVLMSRTPAHC